MSHRLANSFYFTLQRFIVIFSVLAAVMAGDALGNAVLFVGTYTEPMGHVPNAKGEGIYLFNLNPTHDGSFSLAPAGTIGNITNPTFLDITHNKKYMYAVTESAETDKTYIHGYKIQKGYGNGELEYEWLGSWSIGSEGACHVQFDPADRFVFVSNYNGGSVAAFKIDPANGNLEKSNFIQFTEHSNVNPDRQEKPHLHCSVVDWKMGWVYFADLGNDCVWAAAYSNETGFDKGRLRKYEAPAGSGPRHMAMDPANGRFLYVSCELSNHLLVYKVEEEGRLVRVQYEPTTTTPDNQHNNAVSDIHTSPDGRFVYIATRFIDILSVFQIDHANGHLTPVQEIKTGGQIPRNFLLSSSPENIVLVANQATHNITQFKRNPENGKLSQINSWPVNTPVCLKIVNW